MQPAAQREEKRHAVDVGLLRQAQLFAAMDEATLTTVASVAQVQTFRVDEMISAIDGLGDTTFVVASGCVRSYLLSATGNSITLNILRRGGVFGSPLALMPRADFGLPPITGGSRHKSYFQTITETIVYRIPNHHLQQLIGSDPKLATALVHLHSFWVDLVLSQLEILAFLSVPQRLAHTLARLAAANDRHLVLETHQELAWLVGASREKVTKELNKLRLLNLIEYEPHHHGIYVRDPERLGTL